jgi:hypothetical protein
MTEREFTRILRREIKDATKNVCRAHAELLMAHSKQRIFQGAVLGREICVKYQKPIALQKAIALAEWWAELEAMEIEKL